MTDYIHFGSRRIDYAVSYSDRKTLGITVTPAMEVQVKAPASAPKESIRTIVRKKAPWIIKQQGYFLSFLPRTPERKYVSGETHLYLGREYLLKVRIGKKDDVKYKGSGIEIITSDKKKSKELMHAWYRRKAQEKFAEIAEPLIQRFKKYKVEPSGLYIQNMKYQWGSCTSKGKILLNPELIKAPKRCIEYVIIHELCHLVHHNHTAKFFELQEKEMPDWERWKGRLEGVLT